MQTAALEDISFMTALIELFLLCLLVFTVRNNKIREAIMLGCASLFVFFVYAMFIAALLFNGAR